MRGRDRLWGVSAVSVRRGGRAMCSLAIPCKVSGVRVVMA